MMFVNKNPINSHSIPLGVMPNLAGYFDFNVWILYFHSCSLNFWIKLKRFMVIINFWNTVLDAIIMRHIISWHSSMHSVASWSGIYRLTNGYAFEYHFVGCLRFLSCRCWRYWVATLDSLVVVFSHVTLMPRRNLDSRVCCSHMIELLGARWCLVCVT